MFTREMTTYQTRIQEIEPAVNPRHIEGLMRVHYGTLDHLNHDDFKHEVHVCAVIALQDYDTAEEIATSYGL